MRKLIGQDVWSSDIARYGIDIWLTTTEIVTDLVGRKVDNRSFPGESWCRIASFVNRTKELSTDEAEEVVEEQARVFKEMKEYPISRRDNAWPLEAGSPTAC